MIAGLPKMAFRTPLGLCAQRRFFCCAKGQGEGECKMRILGKSIFLTFVGILYLTTSAHALDVTFQWDANKEADLGGYKVYYRTGSSGDSVLSNYNGTGAHEGNSPIAMPLALDENADPDIVEFTVTNLPEGQTYYFVVTAYNNDVILLESGPSNEENTGSTSPPSDTTSPSIMEFPTIDHSSKTIVITYTENEMKNATREGNYRFSPSLNFITPLADGDDITCPSPNSYRLAMTSIPDHQIFSLTVSNITDAAGNPVTPNSTKINDNDNDDMPDDWERENGVDKPDEDMDGDGLNNIEEYMVTTDPGNSDTDNDGINDGEELALWGDNWDADYDGDGIINLLDADADNDGFLDGNEVNAGSDPGVPDLKLPSTSLALEVGELTVDGTWQTVIFNQSFIDPVVVCKPLSLQDNNPAVVRIRNVNSNGFEIHVQEWDYLDETHAIETVGFIAMERGSYTLADGTMIEAGRFETDSAKKFETISFDKPFQLVPVVITAVASVNEVDTVTTRLRNITTNGFEFRMQEQELNAPKHALETVSYIAWEPSAGAINDLTFEVDRTTDLITEKFYTIQYNLAFSTIPTFLADMQTTNDQDAANLRWKNKDSYGIDIKADEGQSRNREMKHRGEVVGYMVFGRGE
jgi:hypothetical protein